VLDAIKSPGEIKHNLRTLKSTNKHFSGCFNNAGGQVFFLDVSIIEVNKQLSVTKDK